MICKSNRQDILFYYSRLLRLKIVLSYEGGYCGAYLYNALVSGRVAWEDELSVWSSGHVSGRVGQLVPDNQDIKIHFKGHIKPKHRMSS